MDNGKKYYSVAETADYFSVSASTVRNWINAGTIKTVKIGRLFRIPADELHRLEQLTDTQIEDDNQSGDA